MNMASIVLGVVSLAFALCGIRRNGCLHCCTGSLVSCGLALVLQIGELYRLTLVGDVAAIYDTAYARLVAACWLLGLNAGCHIWALARKKRGERQSATPC